MRRLTMRDIDRVFEFFEFVKSVWGCFDHNNCMTQTFQGFLDFPQLRANAAVNDHIADLGHDAPDELGGLAEFHGDFLPGEGGKPRGDVGERGHGADQRA